MPEGMPNLSLKVSCLTCLSRYRCTGSSGSGGYARSLRGFNHAVGLRLSLGISLRDVALPLFPTPSPPSAMCLRPPKTEIQSLPRSRTTPKPRALIRACGSGPLKRVGRARPTSQSQTWVPDIHSSVPARWDRSAGGRHEAAYLSACKIRPMANGEQGGFLRNGRCFATQDAGRPNPSPAVFHSPRSGSLLCLVRDLACRDQLAVSGAKPVRPAWAET